MLLVRKAMTNLDSILKSRDITLLTKVQIVKEIVFLVVIYRCEGWTIKKAEHCRNDDYLFPASSLHAPYTSDHPVHHFMAMGKKLETGQALFSWAPKSLWMVTVAMKLKDTHSLKERL